MDPAQVDDFIRSLSHWIGAAIVGVVFVVILAVYLKNKIDKADKEQLK